MTMRLATLICVIRNSRTLGATVAGGIVIAVSGCNAPAANPARVDVVDREMGAPERLIPDDIESRRDSLSLTLYPHRLDTDEEAQPESLPPLAFGMSLEMIRDGDRLFHSKGGCVSCHGTEAQGLAARGKTLTANLVFIPVGDWNAIDSVISVGMPDARSRSPIAMPPRGQHSDLNGAEMRMIAAYIWAISQARGEPWSGGHTIHRPHDWRASARTSIP